nr:hypothetical protein [uncultured Albidiferax sp.]
MADHPAFLSCLCDSEHAQVGKAPVLDFLSCLCGSERPMERGRLPDELEALQLTQYRQIISGMNRVVYETRQDAVYIHAIVDTRRDMKSFLMRRLLR